MNKKHIWIILAFISSSLLIYNVIASKAENKKYKMSQFLDFENDLPRDSITKTIVIRHDPETLFIKKHSYGIKPAKVIESITFADMKVPIGRHDVYESLDRELNVNTYWHSATLLLIKRAGRWFPLIESILKKNNIPEDFKYLALIESGLQNIKSPAGAAGYWQFLSKTGKEYGLEIDSDVDERYHVEKATEAACKYLNDSYEDFNDWFLVAASYNAGKRRIRESLEDQKVKTYFDLLLNSETARYIYRILAIKTIFENPHDYGFYLNKSDLYQPFKTKTVKVNYKIKNLVDFAQKHGTTYKMLKIYNPWLRKSYLKKERGKTFEILIPE
ncbi:MAG: lytic transglycosylase domain-containing protein [Hyphomicrobiales bacterium]